ncbi:MAG: hypothetical protein HYY36_03265, partial [Gammaproteobacteria bacterium]|nr:hypothetical protein [Gammaproteobacteria bacterium]
RRAGETPGEAAVREARMVRENAGIIDISTLGKFEVVGPGAREFLDRLYINNVSALRPGCIRYGVMLREDGMVLDDGTITCLDPGRFFVTSTTAGAQAVQEHLEYWLEVCWPELDAAIFPVGEQWAAVAVAGPDSRSIVQRVVPGVDVGARALPHMHALETDFAGGAARILRVSFSGEIAFEVYVPATCAERLGQALLQHGAAPYGLDALEILRIEKGYFAMGAEADGRATPLDLGLARILARKRTPFVGQHALARPALRRPDRPQIVGLIPGKGRETLQEGSQILAASDAKGFGASIGRISSAAPGAVRGASIALAMINGGSARRGQTVYVADPVRGRAVPFTARVVDPCFYDPEARRLRTRA